MTVEEINKEAAENRRRLKEEEEIEWNAYLKHISSTIHCPLCDNLHGNHSHCQRNDEWPEDWDDWYSNY